ncbi:MAG: hypothetical protein SGARI_006430, partial [Bacillariaceae sp.]
MPLVTYTCSASAPGILALKLLAKIQDTEVDFTESSETTPSLKVVTTNPVLGSSSTSTSVSWVGCARTLSQLVPSLGLWDGPTVESWIESAATAVIPATSDDSGKAAVEEFLTKLEAHLAETKNSYVTGSFTAADVCLSVWIAQAMTKCSIEGAGETVSGWLKSVLTALKSCDSSVSPLLSAVSGGASSGGLDDNPLVQKLKEFGVEMEVYAHEACMK